MCETLSIGCSPLTGMFCQQIASLMGLFSFIGSSILLAFSLAQLFARKDYDPLQPVTVVFMYWIVCDLLSALATMANLRWALQGAPEEGGYCRAQGMCTCFSDVYACQLRVMEHNSCVSPNWRFWFCSLRSGNLGACSDANRKTISGHDEVPPNISGPRPGH